MLYQTLTTNQAAHLLMQDEYARWSYEAATAICEWLEEIGYEDDKRGIAFCPVAIRCDFTEYVSIEEACEELGFDDEEALNDNHAVLYCDNGGVVVHG